MKKYILILLTIGFSSCSKTPEIPKNPLAETTAELVQMAKQDTSTYKVVIIKDNLYALDVKTNIVKYKVRNDSEHIDALFLLMMMLLAIVFILALMKS